MHALETSRLLTEEYTAKILLATMGKPKSAFELSERLNIPIAACYRKIRVLEEAGLLVCDERKLTQAGKRMSVYRSRVLNAQIVFENGKSAGVRYRVVRQYADKSGGWHTRPEDVRGIVATAVEKAREAWRESGGPA